MSALQGFERLRNRLPLIDHRLIGDAARRELPQALVHGSMTRMLISLLRLSPGEAARRVRAAESLGTPLSMLGEPLSPRWAHLAAAQRLGEVSPDQVSIIERALAKVDRCGFAAADVEAGEQLVTRFAETFAPKDLKRLADQVVDAIDPDGTLPDDQLNHDRRHLNLRPTRDGAYAGEFRLTGTLGAKLTALLEPLAKPRVDASTADQDPRTRGQRLHDAMEELCDRLLRAGNENGTGGTPASVIVTIDMDDLLRRSGYGTTNDGTLIPTETVLRMAGEADVIPTVLARGGAVLSLGRTRRIASRSQTFALAARDRGCSFPGCDRAPEWCERHHIKAWIDGGATDLDNLTLLCSYHHHNFETRGWTCTINADGLPEWQPPRWIDRDQRPLINTRIQGHRAAQRHRRMRT